MTTSDSQNAAPLGVPQVPSPGMDAGFCPVYRAICILQEKWTLHIIRSLLQGDCGFNELVRHTRCNTATLSARIADLEQLGLIHKTAVSGRSVYALTFAGRELSGVTDAIAQWAQTHLKE